MDCQYSVGEVWLQEFPFLKFRPLRQHPECATCIKFKCLLRSLGHHLVARQKQLEEYHQHLDSQYQDRLTYWSHRGHSRTRGSSCTLIIDGMDQSKFCYPRHRCLKSKEFASFQRPKAHIVGVLIHGRAILFSVSEPDVQKDASTPDNSRAARRMFARTFATRTMRQHSREVKTTL